MDGIRTIRFVYTEYQDLLVVKVFHRTAQFGEIRLNDIHRFERQGDRYSLQSSDTIEEPSIFVDICVKKTRFRLE